MSSSKKLNILFKASSALSLSLISLELWREKEKQRIRELAKLVGEDIKCVVLYKSVRFFILKSHLLLYICHMAFFKLSQYGSVQVSGSDARSKESAWEVYLPKLLETWKAASKVNQFVLLLSLFETTIKCNIYATPVIYSLRLISKIYTLGLRLKMEELTSMLTRC